MKAVQVLGSSIIVILILCFSVAAQQSNLIQLTGRIFDLNGAVCPGIKVVAYSPKKVKYEQLSDENGVFLLKLSAGIYTLEINKQIVKYNGFESLKLKNYRVVPSDDKINLDISLDTMSENEKSRLTVANFALYTRTTKYKKSKNKRKNGIQL